MKSWMQKMYRGQMGVYLQFFALLLLASATMLAAMSVSGCWCDDCDGSSYYGSSSSSAGVESAKIPDMGGPLIEGPVSVSPGGRVNLKVHPVAEAGKRKIIWTPPPGATNFQFPGKQPEPGGPPFVFKDVDEYDDLRMSYTAPSGYATLEDTVQSVYKDGMGTVVFSTHVSEQSQTVSLPPAASPPQQKHFSATTVDAWKVTLWLDAPEGTPLTTEACQEWADKLKGEEFFVAARMPMTTTAITGSYRLPFVFGSPYSQTLYLDDYTDAWDSPMLLTATLEYRPERLTFLENELPQAAGEHWAALGISTTEPLSCPTGLNTTSWGLKADLLLDLHDQPDACEGCTVWVYGCYEGQTSPLESLKLRAAAQAMGVESYQGEGITCLGPKPIHLEPFDAGLHLGGTVGAVITPTLPITLHEYIENQTGNVITVTLTYTSSVRNWQFYGGDWESPDTGSPIAPGTTEIAIPQGGIAHIWAIDNPVPADTVAGPHSLVVTVTSTGAPDLSTWDSIPLWSGDWVAPPLPGAGYKIYLPLVVRAP